MKNGIQERVLTATAACLRPLARVLMRSGINYRQFAEVAKDAFVEEALGERDARGRIANTSRVAIRTGLSRKEVARIKGRNVQVRQAGDHVAATSSRSKSGHAARILQIWHSDLRFLSPDGMPRELPYAGDDASFITLARLVGGDIPAGAVRAELMSAGAVTETVDGLLKPIKRHFVPGNVDEDLVVGLNHIVYPVVEGLARNTGPLKEDPFVQRLAYSDRLLPAAVPLFRQLARDKSVAFLASVDDWLSAHEVQPDMEFKETTRVGIGVFFFEGAPPEDSSPESVSPIP